MRAIEKYIPLVTASILFLTAIIGLLKEMKSKNNQPVIYMKQEAISSEKEFRLTQEIKSEQEKSGVPEKETTK